jgi:hypothetical protein
VPVSAGTANALRGPADHRGHLVGRPGIVLPARRVRHGHRLAGRQYPLCGERAPGRIRHHARWLAPPAARLALTAHPMITGMMWAVWPQAVGWWCHSSLVLSGRPTFTTWTGRSPAA